MSSKKRFFILDGFGLFFKAYFAVPHLSTPDGLPTNALLGFVNMVKRILQKETPDYIAVALESETKTFRQDIYPEYKAHRPEVPQDLLRQVPYLLKLCDAFKLHQVSVEGYEADDVMASLALLAKKAGMEVVLVTNDKDLFQMVGEGITMMAMKKGADIEWYTPESGKEKYGVSPEQMGDKLALTGDSSDNIPGAPGIGEKGAIQLLEEYGTLENLLKHASHVKSKRYRESLEKHQEQILLSKILVSLKTDLSLPLSLESFKKESFQAEELIPLLTTLHFQALLQELKGQQNRKSLAPQHWIIYETQTLPDFSSRTSSKTPLFLLPLYADSSDDKLAFPCLKGLLLQDSETQSIHGIKATHPEFATWLVAFLNHCPSFVLLNFKKLARCVSLSSKNTLQNRCSDLLLLAYLRESNLKEFSLKALALHLLQETLPEEQKITLSFLEVFSQFKENQSLPPLQKPLLQEIEFLFWGIHRLSTLFQETSSALQKVYHDIEFPLSLVLAKIENRGIFCDPQQLQVLSKEFAGILEKSTEKIYQLAGEPFNINSPKQLGSILFEKMKLPLVKKTKGGDWSTDEEVLSTLSESHELPKEVLHYRHFSKLKSTYVDALPLLIHPKTQRIHSTFSQVVAATGRLSSSDPNLQNIPIRTAEGEKIRTAFATPPSKGAVLLAADYSQIELRIFAHLSEDSVLCDAFQKGEDIHERTARELFGNSLQFIDKKEMRRRAKTINFGVIYGQSPFGLASQLNISQKEAKAFIESYFERYQGVKRWLAQAVKEAEKTGYASTLFGRIRPIPELKSSARPVRSFGERTAINTPVQGTAADLIKMAMIQVEQEIEEAQLKSQMILSVHDELVFEVPEEEISVLAALVRRVMENIYPLKVPLVVQIGFGKNWAETK